MINSNNFMAWLLGGMVAFMVLGGVLGVYVDPQLTFVLFGAMGWLGFMLFYKLGKVEEIEQEKWEKESDQWVADYMKDERLRRERK
jgi:uncharacterized membrane protein YuzA (DUF378 family)